MSYSYLTFGQMKQNLAERLGDSGMQYWTNAASYSELGLILQDAIRTWSALTQQWRTRVVFNTAASQPWYDLSASASSARGYSVTDQQAVALMEYMLGEPLGLTSWQGSALFTLADLTNALERRRNQFIAETGCTRSVLTQASGTPGDGRVSLPDTVIEVLKAYWSSGGLYTPLWREDEFRLQAFLYGYQNHGTPQAYSVAATPPLTMQIAPPFESPANIELVVTQTGAALNPATGVLLGIPDEFAWAVRFGALADLLSMPGEASDPQRAKYCQQRWDEGVTAARTFAPVVAAQINGVPVMPESLHNLDAYSWGWRSAGGAPVVLALAGWNLVALSPVPDAGPYSVTLDVVTTPTPVNDTDQVQLGREDLDAVLSYAVHLAAFKQGGAEFSASGSAFNDFALGVKSRNARIEAMIPSLGKFVEQNRDESRQVPEKVEQQQ